MLFWAREVCHEVYKNISVIPRSLFYQQVNSPAAITNRIRFQKPDTISNVQVPLFQVMVQGSRLFLSSDSTVFQSNGWQQRIGSWKIVQNSFSRFF